MKTGYLDCFSGISGDMFLGALLHAGLDENLLLDQLATLELADASIEVVDDMRQSISCKKVHISEKRVQQFRHLPAILELIDKASLDPEIKLKSSAVFQYLAEAEAAVHGIGIDRVHFHEIGALDTIYDVVGVVIGLHHLQIERLLCSPIPLGRGFVNCDHGRLPLPAPAVCELLREVPSYGVEIEQELVTPTGAALVKILVDDFGSIPPMTIERTGYGAGSRTLPGDQPNLLRLIIGQSLTVEEHQTVEIIETRLDDWNPESYPHLCQRLLERGALDVSLTPCQGKKGRPGYHLQVICSSATSTLLQDILLAETPALGLRCRKEQRRTLPRKKVLIPSPWGEIAAKEAQTPRGPVLYPEYEVCRKIADLHNIPIDSVYRAVYAHKV